MRTATVHCAVHLPDTLALRVVRRSAVPTDTLMRWSVDDSVTILGPPGSSYDWYGMALVPTIVTIKILVTADSLPIPPLSLTMGFTPKPRPNWGKLDMDSSAVIEVEAYDPKDLMRKSTFDNFTLSAATFVGNVFADTSVYTTSDTSGPNRSLSYMVGPGHLPPWIVYMNPVLYASPNPPVGLGDTAVYNRTYPFQTGDTIPNDSLHRHYCSHAELTAAIPTLERHEGVGRMPNSHYGVADTLVRNPPGIPPFDVIFEGLVRDDSKFPALHFAAEDTLRHFLAAQDSTVFRLRQLAFDTSDSANINAALNHCRPNAR